MKNILSKLQQAKGNNPTEVFDDFMYKCTRFRDNESSNIFQNGWQSDGLGRFYSQETIQRNQSVELIPFREINILTSSGHVIRFLPNMTKVEIIATRHSRKFTRRSSMRISHLFMMM